MDNITAQQIFQLEKEIKELEDKLLLTTDYIQRVTIEGTLISKRDEIKALKDRG